MEIERKSIVEYGKKLYDSGLTKGTGGNISIYNKELGYMAISPSGIPYHETKVSDIVIAKLNGEIVDGDKKPSCEFDMHAIIYKNRPEFSSVVHAHSIYAASLSCLRKNLPAVDYLVAFGGGKDVKCAQYATYGTPELAINALEAMKDRNAVLLANHGINVCGPNLPTAFSICEQLEFCAELYLRALSVGEPTILSDKEMEMMVERFKTYGQK